MATIQELMAKQVEMQTALDAEQAVIQEAIAALTTEVANLQAIVVNGGTEAERQALLDAMNATLADLQATMPPA